MPYSRTTLSGVIATRSLCGLLIVVVAKSVVFLWKSDFRKPKAVYYVTAASLYSMVPGMVVAFGFTVPTLLAFGVPLAVLDFAFLIPAKSLKRYRRFEKYKPKSIALVLFGIALATAVLWSPAVTIQDTSYLGYWLRRIVCSIVAVGVSFLVSVVCEDAIISRLYQRDYGTKKSFLEPVVWCNVVAFVLVVGLAAAIAIPKRLGSPGFLVARVVG